MHSDGEKGYKTKTQIYIPGNIKNWITFGQQYVYSVSPLLAVPSWFWLVAFTRALPVSWLARSILSLWLAVFVLSLWLAVLLPGTVPCVSGTLSWVVVAVFCEVGLDEAAVCLSGVKSLCLHVLNGPPSRPCTKMTSAYTGLLEITMNQKCLDSHLYTNTNYTI